jgi:hypothetical protein
MRSAALPIFMIAVSLLAVSPIGCGGGLRAKFLAYDEEVKKTPKQDKAAMDKLVVELVDATKADPKEVIRLYRTDPDVRVRSTCATFLWLSDIKEAAPELEQGAKSDPDVRVSTMSLDALAQLVHSFPNDTEVARAAISTAQYDLSRAKPAGYLFDAEISAQLKESECIAPLAAALPDDKPALWTAGIRAIAAVGGKDAGKALADLRKRTKDPARQALLDRLAISH